MKRAGKWVDDGNAVLLTDLYELTMAASYFSQGMNDSATFDLFIRKLPAKRNFLVAAGLEVALDFLSTARFDEASIDYLSSLDLFPDDFLDYLAGWRFSGEVRAVPEGDLVFPLEPLLSVTAPLIEAQVVETFLLNCVTFSTMVASKAARVAIAAQGRRFDDFSVRRDHGADAGLKAARAAYIGGAGGTSNVLAGMMFGIPVSGTMAHSYVMAFEDEEDAFRRFAGDNPGRATLLIDTYDTLEGARRAARLVAEGVDVRAVRLDSGDLKSLAPRVRAILDAAGATDVEIFASGDLDESRIAELIENGAPIDGYGVGTQLGTSGDEPSLGGVYKLVEYGGRPVAKLSTNKKTLPGRKQIHRFTEDGVLSNDVIAIEDEDVGGRKILEPVMRDGRALRPSEALDAIRRRCGRALDILPEALRTLEPATRPYAIRHSPGLEALARQTPGAQ